MKQPYLVQNMQKFFLLRLVVAYDLLEKKEMAHWYYFCHSKSEKLRA